MKLNQGETKQLDGSTTYRCKYYENWVTRNPCVSSALKYLHAFPLQFVLKIFSSYHRVFCDILHHRSSASHEKFKKKLKNQKQPDNILKDQVIFKSKLPYFLLQMWCLSFSGAGLLVFMCFYLSTLDFVKLK